MGVFKTLAGKLFAYSDGTYDRAAMGDLDAYTGPNGVTSQAQAGFRAIDQNGNAIFDSMGLMSVMSMPTGPSGWSGDYQPGAVFTVMPGSPLFLSLVRQTTFLLLVAHQGKCTSTGAGVFCVTAIFADDIERGVSEALWDKGVPGFTNGMSADTVTLGPGTHKIDARVKTDDVNTHFVSNGSNLWVFQMGS